MSRLTLEERLQLHKDFWDMKEMSEPIVTYRKEDFFYTNKYEAASEIRKKNVYPTPDMVHVDDFLEDYETQYQDCEVMEQTGFWTAEPYLGIPWMEAMVGCPFVGEEDAFMALSTCNSLEEIGDLHITENNPWVQKYLEFIDKLVKFSDGRFPVGQSLLRGVTDVVGTKMGQAEFPYAVMDEPELIMQKFMEVAESLRFLHEETYKRIPSWNGGYAGGLYSVWAPGKIVWFQEDLAAILSKVHYNQFIRSTSEYIMKGYDYTMVHLHPSSFHHLDDMLKVPQIRCMQINEDVSGPTVQDMIPQFKKCLEAGKTLMILAILDPDDVAYVMDHLPHYGLFFHLAVPDIDYAKEINKVLKTRWK